MKMDVVTLLKEAGEEMRGVIHVMIYKSFILNLVFFCICCFSVDIHEQLPNKETIL